MTIADVRQERDDLRAENNALAIELADALAEVTRLKGAIHADLIADTHYCDRHEMMFQCGYGAAPWCPHCEVELLRAALLKVYECEGCRHCSDLTGTALDTTSTSTKEEP